MAQPKQKQDRSRWFPFLSFAASIIFAAGVAWATAHGTAADVRDLKPKVERNSSSADVIKETLRLLEQRLDRIENKLDKALAEIK